MKKDFFTKEPEWWEGMTREEYLEEMHRLYMIADKEIEEIMARRKEEKAKAEKEKQKD